jgi:hypothetical protein
MSNITALGQKGMPSLDQKAPSDYVVVDKEVKTVSPPVRVLSKGTAQMASGLISLRRGSGKKRSRSKNGKLGIASLPPELDATVSFSKKYRYIAQDASATAKTVTVGTILVSMGSMAITTTQVSSLCSSFRIKKITMYPALGTGVTPLLEWVDAATTGLNVKDEKVGRSIPAGVTVEAPITIRPPKNSEISWWWDAQATGVTLFVLSAPVGTILDLDVEATIVNSGTNVQETSYTSLTVGAIYYPALEGRSTNDWAPVGRTNAT